MIYINRNSYNRSIGTAAIFRKKNCIYLLRQNTIYTVYSAEFAEIELVLDLAEIKNLIRLTLATDKSRNLVVLTDN